MKKKKMNWKIFLKKFGFDIALVILVMILVFIEQNPYYAALIPVVKGGINLMKHLNYGDGAVQDSLKKYL